MFARFDENPAMTLRVIKETKRYGRTHGRTDGQPENSIPPTNKVCGGIIKCQQQMPTIVGILTFINRIDTTSEKFKAIISLIFSILDLMSS